MAPNNPITIIVQLIGLMHAALRGPGKARKDYKTKKKERTRSQRKEE